MAPAISRSSKFDRQHSSLMTSDFSDSPRRSDAGALPVPADRRRRTRLRDLCDEVLASFRMARQPDRFSEADRVEGHALIAAIARGAR